MATARELESRIPSMGFKSNGNRLVGEILSINLKHEQATHALGWLMLV